MCAELAELGMDLARAAAAKALTQQAEPEEPPAADSPPEPEPASPAKPAQAARPPRAAGARGAVTKPTCAATIFTRLTATILACITLEARLAAAPAPQSRGATHSLRADPRRTPLRDIFRRITEHHPDRAELVRETTARTDETLAADPDQINELPTIFFSICAELGIEIDYAILPDSILGLAPDEPPIRIPDS